MLRLCKPVYARNSLELMMAPGLVRADASYSLILLLTALLAMLMTIPLAARAQGGPPYLTNDPGTPGNANWEINLGALPTVVRGASSYQLPQVDLNFGVGERIQLTFEIPYELATAAGQPSRSGWSNGYPGVKWRFLDQGDDGWQVSAFPQVELGASTTAYKNGLASPGPRYLLPLEAAHRLGPVDVDVEAGYIFPGKGPRERFLGLVIGRAVTDRLEFDAEIYNDRVFDTAPQVTTVDLGGRYRLRPGVIALFMAGRGVDGGAAEPSFLGYFGIQILLTHYGRQFDTGH